MADKILKELTLKIWRQKDAKSKGEFKTYKVHNMSTGTSFLVVCSSTAVLTDRTMM